MEDIFGLIKFDTNTAVRASAARGNQKAMRMIRSMGQMDITICTESRLMNRINDLSMSDQQLRYGLVGFAP